LRSRGGVASGVGAYQRTLETVAAIFGDANRIPARPGGVRPPMSVTAAEKTRIIEENRRHEKDSGSTEVQVAVMTERIANLTTHMKKNKHDFHNQRGLVGLVNKRNKLLRYLSRTDRDRYQALIKKLGLRK
jgi:small subunit ribosomal protein S15